MIVVGVTIWPIWQGLPAPSETRGTDYDRNPVTTAAGQAAPLQLDNHLMKHVAKLRFVLRLLLLQLADDRLQVSWPGPGRNETTHVAIERDKPNTVLLLQHEIGQAGSRSNRIVVLRRAVASRTRVGHRAAGVQI